MKSLSILAGLAGVVVAMDPPMGSGGVQRVAAAVIPVETGTFEQLIDHDNPSLGTFSQRYFYNADFYQGPGSPIVLYSPGEGPADLYKGYATNKSITGTMAQTLGGAAVILEHRYYGESMPFSVLDTKNLQLLTMNQSIADHVHFAKTVKLPFDPQGSSNADKAPWVFSGVSYSAMLVAYTEVTQPGTFWAYHASSAPLETIRDFSNYWTPIERGLPQNCTTDLALVIKHVDEILTTGSADEQLQLKTLFGLQAVEHNDDLAVFLARTLSTWQRGVHSPYAAPYQVCDAVEGVFNVTNPTIPGPEGVGFEKALANYAGYVATTFVPGFCARRFGKYITDPNDLSCLDSHNASAPWYTDRDPTNPTNLPWTWLVCNEPLSGWQGNATNPADPTAPRIFSSLITVDHWTDGCARTFPPQDGYTYGLAAGRTEGDVNQWTGGWDARNRTRIIFSNGEFDPWLASTVSSPNRPGGPQQSTPDQPVYVIKGGIHGFDMITSNTGDPNVKVVFDAEIAQIKQWVSEFKPAA